MKDDVRSRAERHRISAAQLMHDRRAENVGDGKNGVNNRKTGKKLRDRALVALSRPAPHLL